MNIYPESEKPSDRSNFPHMSGISAGQQPIRSTAAAIGLSAVNERLGEISTRLTELQERAEYTHSRIYGSRDEVSGDAYPDCGGTTMGFLSQIEIQIDRLFKTLKDI